MDERANEHGGGGKGDLPLKEEGGREGGRPSQSLSLSKGEGKGRRGRLLPTDRAADRETDGGETPSGVRWGKRGGEEKEHIRKWAGVVDVCLVQSAGGLDGWLAAYKHSTKPPPPCLWGVSLLGVIHKRKKGEGSVKQTSHGATGTNEAFAFR